MKKIVILLTGLLLHHLLFAATGLPNANEIFFPISNSGKQISLLALSQISITNFEVVSGRRMKFREKVIFKIAQNKLRNSINADGTVNSNKFNNLFKKMTAKTGAAIAGFALGFWGSIVGVLIAYVIDDNNKRKRVTWAWIGFGLGSLFLIAWLLA